MARTEARLSVTIWADADFVALPPTAQRMYLFLLSQPDLAHDGVIALRERRWAKTAAGLTAGQVSDDLDALAAARFAIVDEDAEELLVRSFIRRDKVYRQPNVLRAAADHLPTVTSPIILGELAMELERVLSADDYTDSVRPILTEMLSAARKGSSNPSGNPSRNPQSEPTETLPESHAEESPKHAPSTNGGGGREAQLTPLNGHEPLTQSDNTPGDKGSPNPNGNPSGKGSAGTPGERGMVTVVSRDSPYPLPLAPVPRPHSSSGGGARASANADPGDPRGTEKPPRSCPKHINDPTDPPCGACRAARERADDWEQRRAAANAAHASTTARERAALARAAIDACTLCDPTGYVDTTAGPILCHHDPDNADRTARGAAMVAALIGKGPRPRDTPVEDDEITAASKRRAAQRAAHTAEQPPPPSDPDQQQHP